MRTLLLTAALAAPVLPAAAGERLRFEIDPDESRLAFTLDATAHKVHGTIAILPGSLEFDPETGALSGEVVADAATAETGNRRRDKKMHRDVLESKTHPRIALIPERIIGRPERDRPSTLELEGRIRIHGEAHRVRIPLRVLLTETRLEAEASFAVPYVAWGLEDPSFFLLRVGKEVDVEVRLVAHLDAVLPPAPPEEAHDAGR